MADDKTSSSSSPVGHAAEMALELVRAELPLVPGLRALAEEFPGGRDRRALLELAASIEGGAALQEALTSRRAPAGIRAIFEVAERSEHPVEIIEEYLTRVRRLASTYPRIVVAIAYPLFVIAFAAAVLILLVSWLVPEFETIYRDFNLQLTQGLLALLSVARFINESWRTVLLTVLGLLALTGLFLGWRLSAARRRRMLWRVPLIGMVVRNLAVSRMIHTLAILLRHGVVLPTAVRAAGDVSGDAVLRAQSEQLAEELERGASDLSGLQIPGVPLSLLETLALDAADRESMIAVHDLADMLERQTQATVNVVMGISRPLVVISAGLAVVLCVYLLFEPLFRLVVLLS